MGTEQQYKDQVNAAGTRDTTKDAKPAGTTPPRGKKKVAGAA